MRVATPKHPVKKSALCSVSLTGSGQLQGSPEIYRPPLGVARAEIAIRWVGERDGESFYWEKLVFIETRGEGQQLEYTSVGHQTRGNSSLGVSGLLPLLISQANCRSVLPCDAMQKHEMRALMMFLMVVLGDRRDLQDF